MPSTQQDFVNRHAHRLEELLGKPSSALDALETFKEPEGIVVPDTFETVREPEGIGVAQDTWYAGSITIGGFVYSSVDVRFHFGSYGDYVFSAGFWGGFGGGAGGGGGPWVDGALPSDGEKMDFQIAFGSFEGGSVEMFWWRSGGPIQGSIVAAIAGLGVGGSKGSGTWKKA